MPCLLCFFASPTVNFSFLSGIGTRDLSLTDFPIRLHVWMQTRHLPAPRFLWCVCVLELWHYSSGKSDFGFSPDEFIPFSSSGCQAQCWDWPGLIALGRNIWTVKIHTRHGVSWVMLPLPRYTVGFIGICVHQRGTSVFPCGGDIVPAEGIMRSLWFGHSESSSWKRLPHCGYTLLFSNLLVAQPFNRCWC